MFWENGDGAAEIFEEGSVNLRSDHADGEVDHFGHFNFFACNKKDIGGDVTDLGIVHDVVPGEEDVVGCERLAVTPADTGAQVEGPGLLIRSNRPGLG